MLSDREAALATALKSLRNECHAIRAMSYDAIKDTAGYTNLKVWISRIKEADTLLAKAAGADPVRVCQWRDPGEDDSEWQTGCGKGWTFIDDGPVENGVKFCPYCGKPLALVPAEGDR